ncbi:MAG: hypothetical protein JSS66_12085 [Armatimonadetes bacterium]|nr:hypothetical protein [Armatimonadota bacterium]
MPSEGRPIWTLGRQLVGNIVPLLIALPLLVLGGIKAQTEGFFGQALLLLLGSVSVAWLATNFIGLAGGWGLKAEMGRRLHQERPFDKSEKLFVGFSRPQFSGWLDPHEDVGFLIIHADRLEFFGGGRRVELSKSNVEKIRFKPNIHTWVGLGGWTAIEGQADGTPVRMLVEPRERPTHLGNAVLGRRLRKRLAEWLSA